MEYLYFFNFKLLNNRDVTGKFPDYPDEDEGGSNMIFKNKSVKELEDELADLENSKDKKGKGKGKGKKKKKKEKKGKKGKKGKKDKKKKVRKLSSLHIFCIRVSN